MIAKLIDANGKEIEMKIPIELVLASKRYWVKESTKKEGVYMNSQEPKKNG